VSDEPILIAPKVKAELYLVECTSFGGNSGAPVFFYLDPNREPNHLVLGQPPILKLAGVMMGFFSEIGYLEQFTPGGTSVTNAPPFLGMRLNLGIAGVTPAYKLLEILQEENLKKLRGF
jgi:hypothetical protein